MAALEISVTGNAEVAAALKSAASVLSGKQMEMALVAGGLLIQNGAKQKAPYLTGTLRRSIHIGGHTFAGAEGASDIGGNSDHEIRIGTNLPYARRIEDGFSGVDALGRTYNQPPQSYLRSSMDENRDAAIREVADATRDLLRAAVS